MRKILSRICIASTAIAAITLLFACASTKGNGAKSDEEIVFKPVQIHWIAATPEAEGFSKRDACTVQVMAKILQESKIHNSAQDSLEFNAVYALQDSVLIFDSKCVEPSLAQNPECSWTASCDGTSEIQIQFKP